MPSGGARPGSGNKKGKKFKKTLEAEVMRQIIREHVAANLLPILSAQTDLAMGHFIQVTRDGKKRIYTKSPDKGAAELLLNYGIGKPTQEIVGKDGENLFKGVVYLPVPIPSDE